MASNSKSAAKSSPIPTGSRRCIGRVEQDHSGSAGPRLVFGYIRMEEPDEARIAKLREELTVFCLGQGLHLGGVFCDRGVPEDVVTRVGFTGALDALSVPECFALLVPSRAHLSTVELVEQRLVRMVNRLGCRVLSLPTSTTTTDPAVTTP